jgi:hypothetical protein
MGKSLRRDLKVKQLDGEIWLSKLSYMRRPILDSLMQGLRDSNVWNDRYLRIYKVAVENLRKYIDR